MHIILIILNLHSSNKVSSSRGFQTVLLLNKKSFKLIIEIVVIRDLNKNDIKILLDTLYISFVYVMEC